MNKATNLVSRLLEGDPPPGDGNIDWSPEPGMEILSPEALKAVDQKLRALDQRQWPIGFEIVTSDEHAILENARERGINTETLNWPTLTVDCTRIEKNAMKMFVAHGIVFSPEGHSDTGSLVGTIWLLYSNHEAFKLIHDLLDSGETWSTGSGNIYNLKRSEFLYERVSDIGQQLIDVTIALFPHDEDKQEILDLEI